MHIFIIKVEYDIYENVWNLLRKRVLSGMFLKIS